MATYDPKTLYNQEWFEQYKVNVELLPDVYQDYYTTTLPILYAVDRYMVEQTEFGLTNAMPPESGIPTMRIDDMLVPGESRTGEVKLNYENGRWHWIVYERVEEMERHTFDNVEDLIYYTVANCVGSRAGWTLMSYPELEKDGEEGDYGDQLVASGKLGIFLMHAIKPEWTERYRRARIKKYIKHISMKQVRKLETFDPRTYEPKLPRKK